MKIKIILSFLLTQCLGIASIDRVNQYRQQLAQAGAGEEAFIDASVEAKLLTEQQIQDQHLSQSKTDQKQIDAVWRHYFKTTRFFKLYKQHRFERQQKKILLEKKREELFNIQQNFNILNNKLKKLEENYLKNKKIQKKLIKELPFAQKFISGMINKQKINEDKAVSMQKQNVRSSERVPIKPLRLPKIEQIKQKHEHIQTENKISKTKKYQEHKNNAKLEINSKQELKKKFQPEKAIRQEKQENLGLNMTVGGKNIHVAQKQMKQQEPKTIKANKIVENYESNHDDSQDMEIYGQNLPIQLKLALIQKKLKSSDNNNPQPIGLKLANIRKQQKY